MYTPNYVHLSPNQIQAKEREHQLSIAQTIRLRKRARRKAEKENPGRPLGWRYGDLCFLDTGRVVDGTPRLPG